MAAKLKAVIDPTRVGAIKSALAVECSKFTQADIDKANATEARAEADTEGKSIRETVMAEIAKLSRDNAWREGEVKAACKALKQGDNSGTLTTFMAEIVNVAHPNVRDMFTDLVSMRDALWPVDADPELNPVQADVAKLWTRRYHMLTDMTRRVRKGDAVFAGVQDVIDYAVAHDPDEDADKIQGKLERIAEQLTDMFATFPDEDLKLAADYIAGIDANKLKLARAKVISPGTVIAPKAERPLRGPVKATTTVVENTDGAGAMDLDEILGDKPAHLIAAAA